MKVVLLIRKQNTDTAKMDTLRGISPETLQGYITAAIRSEFTKFLSAFSTPTTPPAETEYLTRKQVAEKLQISLVTLDSYAQAGTLKAYRIGNRVLFKAAEIEQSLKAMKSTRIAA